MLKTIILDVCGREKYEMRENESEREKTSERRIHVIRHWVTERWLSLILTDAEKIGYKPSTQLNMLPTRNSDSTKNPLLLTYPFPLCTNNWLSNMIYKKCQDSKIPIDKAEQEE